MGKATSRVRDGFLRSVFPFILPGEARARDSMARVYDNTIDGIYKQFFMWDLQLSSGVFDNVFLIAVTNMQVCMA